MGNGTFQVLAEFDRRVERPQGDLTKTCASEDAAHSRRSYERKWTRILRSGCWKLGGMQAGRFDREARPFVLARLAPADETDSASRLQRLAQVLKSGGRICKEHDAEARNHQIEGGQKIIGGSV